MTTLILRNVDDVIVQALKARAECDGLSAEAEHLKILKRALLHPTKSSFIDALWSIPNVGIDSDFERV
jgi:plasmid stability protein